MFNWFTSKSIKRTTDILQDPYAVYDLKFLEWEQRKVLLHQEKAYLCVDRNKTYELIFKKDRLSIFSLYRHIDRERVETLYKSVKKNLNIVSEGITTKKPTVIAPILRDIIGSIRLHSNWTSAHIAAKVGLDQLFTWKRLDIISNLNVQKEPDFLTPLHLVIESGRLIATKAVLSLKPKLDLKDRKGNSFIHFAAMSSREILVLILKEPNMFEMLKWKNRKGCTPLHLACFANKTDNVLEFLSFGMTVQMMTVSPPEASLTYVSDDNNIINFKSEDIDDLDTEDMRFGGTPMHWVKHRRTLEKLILCGFRLDVINANGETALYCMVKRFRLKCMIGLLCFGARVQQSNRSGDSPLHCAVKAADVTSTQALIIFDADIDAKNHKKESARHIAAKALNPDHNLVLYLLSAIGAKRCDRDIKGCSSGCAYNGTYEGEPYHRWPKYDNESFYKQVLMEPIIREALKRKAEKFDQKSRRVRMMCLDGGGVRGLITIQILIEMEKQLKYPIHSYFEWISGTSTGSIVATLLATGKPLRELREIYFRFKDKILVGFRPYSSKNFEALLEEELGQLKMCEISQIYNKKLIINATLIDRSPAQLHLFRSYESPEEVLGLPNNLPGFKSCPKFKDQAVWKACRASGAAPTYFRASGTFLDGGLIANNPTLDALSEFRLYNNALKAVGRQEESEELDLVVSFGTGRFPIIQTEPIDVMRMWTLNPRELHKNTLYIKQMGNLLINQVTNTEGHVINRAQSWCSWIRVPYFRVNPPLSEVLSLDETSDVEICNALWETKAYMYAMRQHVHTIIQLLASPQQTESKISNSSQAAIQPRPTTANNVNLSDNQIKMQLEMSINNLNSNEQSYKNGPQIEVNKA